VQPDNQLVITKETPQELLLLMEGDFYLSASKNISRPNAVAVLKVAMLTERTLTADESDQLFRIARFLKLQENEYSILVQSNPMNYIQESNCPKFILWGTFDGWNAATNSITLLDDKRILHAVNVSEMITNPACKKPLIPALEELMK
jgi:hypothetical protein